MNKTKRDFGDSGGAGAFFNKSGSTPNTSHMYKTNVKRFSMVDTQQVPLSKR